MEKAARSGNREPDERTPKMLTTKLINYKVFVDIIRLVFNSLFFVAVRWDDDIFSFN